MMSMFLAVSDANASRLVGPKNLRAHRDNTLEQRWSDGPSGVLCYSVELTPKFMET